MGFGRDTLFISPKRGIVTCEVPMTILAGLLLTTFSFKGGVDSDLISSMADWTKGSVAILADGRRRWPKTTVADERLSNPEVLKLVHRKLSISSSGEFQSQGISSAAWPLTFYRTSLRSVYANGFRKSGPERPEIKKGEITFRFPSSPLSMAEAFPTGAKSTWTWHWFFDEARIGISAGSLTERAFVQLIADAMGANVVEGRNTFYFDINPRVYVQGTIALADQQFATLKDVTGEKYDYLLLREVLKTLTDAQVRQLLKDPQGRLRIEGIRDPSIIKVARQRLQMQYPVVPNDGVKRNHTAKAAWEAIRDAIDFSRPISVILNADGMVSVHYPGTSKAPGGVVL